MSDLRELTADDLDIVAGGMRNLPRVLPYTGPGQPGQGGGGGVVGGTDTSGLEGGLIGFGLGLALGLVL